MASNEQLRRRGLPRRAGGDPWPAEGYLPGDAAASGSAAAAPATQATEIMAPAEAVAPAAAGAVAPAAPETAAPAADAAQAPAVPAADGGAVRRRGLPRVRGGEPWPATGAVAGEAPQAAGSAAPAVCAEPAASAAPAAAESTAQSAESEAAVAATPPSAAAVATLAAEAVQAPASATPLRRGLPRSPGGEPWPTAGFAPAAAMPTVAAAPAAAVPVAQTAPVAPVTIAVPAAPAAPTPAVTAPAVAPAAPAASVAPAAQAPAAPDPAPAPKHAAAPKPAAPVAAAPAAKPDAAPSSLARKLILAALGLVAAAAVIVLAARGLTTLPGVPEFVERYPGEYHLPAFVAEGFPAWARWTHYLNFFFMVLIVRSGLLVRHQQKPPAYYTPKRGGKKVSIFLWLHLSLDVLWLLNGAAFVVLLFATGHWARIVPTSWEVFPNAASAMLQYLTLEWPVENGWVNYNSLQQLMYFTVVFIAAPLAAITGVRMSEWWPEKAEKLNRAYPAPLARAVHFPVMLFFVAFVLVHVFLVFATGMRKNLNHMFAGNDGTGWFGFWMLVIGLAVVAGAWLAARPLLLAPIASIRGKVSER